MEKVSRKPAEAELIAMPGSGSIGAAVGVVDYMASQ